MTTRGLLLQRLEAIARSVQASEHVCALIGLGSVGIERDRLDDYSDLDFFVIVDDGFKQRYIENLDWLHAVHPVAYHFRNTPDGHKLLFADGVFCEFAVFEADELGHIPFAQGRTIWKRAGVDDAICVPRNTAASPPPHDIEWLVGEALTNLHVGLCRHHRGEKLSAEHLVQHFAVDRLLELAALVERETPQPRDAFANARRIEGRFPVFAAQLPRFVQGYERTPESALAILTWLEGHFAIDRAMAEAVRQLCKPSS
jgi:lincosamide nucleotidyltransferase B/F